MNKVENFLFDAKFTPSKEGYTEHSFDGYQAAPLLIYGQDADQELKDRQDRLHWDFVNAVYGEIAPITDKNVALFSARSIISRMYQREGMNGISYLHRQHATPNTELVPESDAVEVEKACYLAERGEGTTFQNHLARRALGMKSIELANLTIINQFRKQLEPRMWDDISELIEADATPKSEDAYRFEILGFGTETDKKIYDSKFVGAMRIGMKRHIGQMPDGAHVKSRTTAIINTGTSSNFDQSLIERFKEMKEESNPYAAMAALPEFQNAVKWLIDNDLPAGLVLARNETVYECVPQTNKS